MIVHQYGLVYTRVTEADLELLRYWRNQDFIRETMQFQEYITPIMQKKWFKKINNKYNYYMIIEHDGKKIGLINCKNADNKGNIAEGGIFIWDKNYLGTSVPVFAALTILEAVFEIFKSGHTSVATVLKSNKSALEFNRKLGYRMYEENEKIFRLVLTLEDYFSKTIKLKKAACSMVGKEKSEFKVFAEPSDLLDEHINQYLLSNNK